jgi:hypothetical protein
MTTSEESQYDQGEASYFKGITPSILADAIFRGGTVKPSPHLLPEEQWLSAAANVIKIFEAYNLDVSAPTTIAFKAINLGGMSVSQAAKYKKENQQLRFCCKKCKARNIFSLVGVGKTITMDGVKCVKMDSVFYHDNDCSGNDRKKAPKLQVFDLDFQEIIGDTFEPLVTKLKTFHFKKGAQQPELPPGSHINYGYNDYIFDDRSYEYLPSPINYADLAIEKHRLTMVRLFFFLVVMNNISDQAAYQILDMVQLLHLFSSTGQLSSFPVMENPNTHLHFYEVSLLFGGHCMNETEGMACIHQICHMDVADLDTDDSRLLFKGKQLPGSFILPLENQRTIYVHTPQNQVTVKKGQVLYFDGDLPHGGITYLVEGDGTDWYPAIHGHIDSTLMKRKRGFFEYKGSSDVYHPDEHLKFEKDLGPPLEAVERTLGILVEEMSNRSEKEDGKEYVKALQKTEKQTYNRSLCGAYRPNNFIDLENDPGHFYTLIHDTTLRLEELSLLSAKWNKTQKSKTKSKAARSSWSSITHLLKELEVEGAFTPEVISERQKKREDEAKKEATKKRKKHPHT